MRKKPKQIAAKLIGMVHKIEKSTDFINYYASGRVARQLDGILDVIEHDLIPPDPIAALETLHTFIQSDAQIVGNADDSNGSIGDTYRRACTLLGKASIAANNPKEAEDIFFDLLNNNNYGTRDLLFNQAANILSEFTLTRLIQKWRLRAADEAPMTYGGIRLRLAQIAKSVGNPELYEEASLSGRPIDDSPVIALDVANVYLQSGKPEIALTKIPSKHSLPHHKYDRSKLLIKVHQALGNQDKIAVEYWELFASTASVKYAKYYLENMPIADHLHAIKRCQSMVLNGPFSPLTKATYFAKSNDIETAAALIENNHNDISGEFYSYILDLANLLEEKYPLALSILYRANLDDILDQGRSKNYHHCIRYARKLETLAQSINDWKDVTPHKTYWLNIQEKHKRKSSFWSQYNNKQS